jgi:ABC-type glycerol-3-phosphate transport system substrate-binding protein
MNDKNMSELGIQRKANREILIFLTVAILLLGGCGPSNDAADAGKTAAPPLARVTLKLVVVDDPAIAAAARGLVEQWSAETGAKFEVGEAASGDVTADKQLPADVVICPSHLVGPLAEGNLLAALPTEIIRQKTGPWADAFDLLRKREACWGARVVAMPLGSPVFCVYYRADLLEKLRRSPPKTWTEFHDLSKALSDKRLGLSCGSFQPLGKGWAGLMLLARAAPYCKHRDIYSSLFDSRSMEPLIDGPPFAKALEELVAAARIASAESGVTDQLAADPAAAREAFWSGRCGMAVSWPSAAWHASGDNSAKPALPSVGLAELPGGEQVYNVAAKTWQPRGEEMGLRVPLLSVAGRVAVISAKCERADAAGKLILWLADRRWCDKVLAVSPATTISGRDQAASPQAWMEREASAEAARTYGASVSDALGRPDGLEALRMPGRAEYLAALDEAVQSAVRGPVSPSEALTHAADEWRMITKRLGLEKQKNTWLHGQGLE